VTGDLLPFPAVISSYALDISTTGQGDVRDLTREVAGVLADSRLTAGLLTVFVTGSTAGITTIEFEPGVVADLGRVFEAIAPRAAHYDHHARWGDDNGSSHVRAALVGPSLGIPFADGQLALGTWQQVVLVEFDTRPRRRQVMVQVMGE
jgi:secondary thiamine-phosphate synthase enzyme